MPNLPKLNFSTVQNLSKQSPMNHLCGLLDAVGLAILTFMMFQCIVLSKFDSFAVLYLTKSKYSSLTIDHHPLRLKILPKARRKRTRFAVWHRTWISLWQWRCISKRGWGAIMKGFEIELWVWEWAVWWVPSSAHTHTVALKTSRLTGKLAKRRKRFQKGADSEGNFCVASSSAPSTAFD